MTSKISNLELSNHPGLGLQEGVQGAMQSRFQKKDYNSLDERMHAEVFTFLDVSDIAHCVVNRLTLRVINLPSLNREKLRQIDRAAWERLISLCDLGIQVNWQRSLQHEVSLRRLNREVTHAANQLHQIQNAQVALTNRAQSRFFFSIDLARVICGIMFGRLLIGPSPNPTISISGYGP